MPDDDDDWYDYYSDDPDSYDPPSDDGETGEDSTEQTERISMLKLELLTQSCNLEGGGPAFNVYRAKIPGGWLVLMQQQAAWHFTPPGHRPYGIGWGYGGTTFIPDPKHKWDGSSID